MNVSYNRAEELRMVFCLYHEKDEVQFTVFVLSAYEYPVGDNTQRGRCAFIHHWFVYQQVGTPTRAKEINETAAT